jgi:uncharacterized membrane protein
MKGAYTETIRIVFRWIIGALLIFAALGKLADLQEFYNTLLAYRLPLSSPILCAVAMILPWLELLCGLLLLANIRTAAALGWSAFLFAVFAICTAQAWVRGLNIGCGCLNLTIIGIHRGSEIAKLMESPAFAFVRALVLGVVVVLLLIAES